MQTKKYATEEVPLVGKADTLLPILHEWCSLQTDVFALDVNPFAT